jgi:glycosyltransferase involved in cell wall biosynthesis
MRRVLLVGAIPPPTGGVASHIQELARALAGAGVAVTIVDPRHHGRLLAHLAAARARGDVVHVHTNGHNRGSWMLAALCSGRRSLLTLHSGLAPAYIAAHRRVTRAVAAHYRHVIAVNREIARALDADTVIPAWTPRSLAWRPAPNTAAASSSTPSPPCRSPTRGSSSMGPARARWRTRSIAGDCGNLSRSWASSRASARWR